MDFSKKINLNFRGGENFRSEAREIAPKSMPLACAKLADDPERSLPTVASVGMVLNVRLRAISDRNFRKLFFAAAKIFV